MYHHTILGSIVTELQSSIGNCACTTFLSFVVSLQRFDLALETLDVSLYAIFCSVTQQRFNLALLTVNVPFNDTIFSSIVKEIQSVNVP